ncbi:dolichyl-phosphate-mannose--protein mannosyltransferase [Chamaesiphon minutus]|uniref:Polyprenol-phosphate-mannose--protein mannosyltransferase n=1 Tax=Chamaesiphon minutus (strain ATCC 27169 / PCC 6605) TaxID=1173020 RepID=K9UL65_CHAP6|nr:phospholipid carrier-dependent glycosyltransferase [Chamaesiphon minutus]AFY94934.1 dolichyl-phosphate-mannose--protein O-mannosyl transferase [Chamaesiphon minutus PCC 6605]
MLSKLDTEQYKKYAIIGIVGVFIVSIGLRFWGLGRFNVLVFDEVYYAKFANNYLTNTKFFNSHPPLSQYLIAIGIWIGDRLPIGQDTTNMLTGSLHSTFSYRWMNALFGSLIPPVVAGLAYQLNQRLSFVFLATLFISLDGLFLVDSRYALNNIYLVFFGLLGQLLLLMASNKVGTSHILLMLGAGISFGASVACKWNGLWFLLGIYLLLAIAIIWKLIKFDRQDVAISNSLIDRLAKIKLIEIAFYLAIVPLATYSLLWIPHLIQNPEPNFIGVQWAILNYHEQIKNGTGVHPYCANWYTWPLLMRPLAYYFKQYKPNFYYDVHAMGNPLLWWFALLAIFGSLWVIVKSPWLIVNRLKIERAVLAPIREINLNYLSVPLFVLINYVANLLPWVRVTRCLYIYHYMGAIVFAVMGLAWFVDVWLRSNSQIWRGVGITTIFSIVASFIFWLPIYLGLPIETSALSWRLWDFWIFNWI